jgi:hypothetical protein
MKMDIDIRVQVPDLDTDKHVEFIENVMAVFRATFPDAEPRKGAGAPSPVTVTLWNDDGTPMDLSYKGRSANAPD